MGLQNPRSGYMLSTMNLAKFSRNHSTYATIGIRGRGVAVVLEAIALRPTEVAIEGRIWRRIRGRSDHVQRAKRWRSTLCTHRGFTGGSGMRLCRGREGKCANKISKFTKQGDDDGSSSSSGGSSSSNRKPFKQAGLKDSWRKWGVFVLCSRQTPFCKGTIVRAGFSQFAG